MISLKFVFGYFFHCELLFIFSLNQVNWSVLPMTNFLYNFIFLKFIHYTLFINESLFHNRFLSYLFALIKYSNKIYQKYQFFILYFFKGFDVLTNNIITSKNTPNKLPLYIMIFPIFFPLVLNNPYATIMESAIKCFHFIF